MTIGPYSKADVQAIETALTKLRVARGLLHLGHAPRAAEYVARALKSAEGALRHAKSKQWRGDLNRPVTREEHEAALRNTRS